MAAISVFLSVAGPDRDQAEILKKALEQLDVHVFYDRTNIVYHHQVTTSIFDARASLEINVSVM